MWGTKSISFVASPGPAAPLDQIKFNPAMTPQFKKTLKKKVLLSVTSLYPFQKEISHGNDFLTIIEMILKKRAETIQDISVFPLLPVGELLVSDRQTVKVERMFQINLVCVVTDLRLLFNETVYWQPGGV